MSIMYPPPMAKTVASSYGIVIPDLQHVIIINAPPDDNAFDELIIIDDSSPTPTIDDLRSMLFDNNRSPMYTYVLMEFTMNIVHGSLASARFLNDKGEDHKEGAMEIARFIIEHHALHANDGVSEEKILKRRIEIAENEKGVEEGEICGICLKEYEADEIMGRLECKHGYHSQCIKKWLLHKNTCPICRARVFWF